MNGTKDQRSASDAGQRRVDVTERREGAVRLCEWRPHQRTKRRPGVVSEWFT